MREILFVAAGGALGSSLRYLAYIYTPLLFGKSSLISPTLLVNLSGCLLMGFLIHWIDTLDLFVPTLRLLLLTGFLGGFTTYSAFGFESLELLRSSYSSLLLYAGLHLILGIAAVRAGLWFGERFVPVV